MKIPCKRIDKEIKLPFQNHPGDGAVDLCAAENVCLGPGQKYVMPTGIAVAIPSGYAGFITPRSGVSSKKPISIANSPGLIDSGYRGEVKIILLNISTEQKCYINRGDKIAQLVIMPVFCPDFYEVESLDDTSRGEDGFGSTGF